MRIKVKRHQSDGQWHITEEPETDDSMHTVVVDLRPIRVLKLDGWVCDPLENSLHAISGPLFFEKSNGLFPDNKFLHQLATNGLYIGGPWPQE